MDCTGTDESWVDEGEGFLVRYAAEIECRAEDGNEWRTRQNIEVTNVGQMKEIALSDGAVAQWACDPKRVAESDAAVQAKCHSPG